MKSETGERHPQVDILLATYNGSRYIRELLDSLLEQTYSHFRILIRDDRSEDETPQILSEYERKHPDKIVMIHDRRGNLGVTNNMFCLLSHSRGDYVMYCDQDDVWRREKVQTLLHAIRRKEAAFPGRALLVHSDSVTVDAKLRPVSADARKSLTSYQTGRDKRKNTFAQLLFCNPAQGAGMIFNPSLRELLLPLAALRLPKAVVYDSITASVCAIHGRVFYLSRPLMYYRQHGKNLVGAKRRSLLLLPFYDVAGREEVLTAHFLQYNRKKADLLSRYYRAEMSKEQLSLIRHFNARPYDYKEIIRIRAGREWHARG